MASDWPDLIVPPNEQGIELSAPAVIKPSPGVIGRISIPFIKVDQAILQICDCASLDDTNDINMIYASAIFSLTSDPISLYRPCRVGIVVRVLVGMTVVISFT